MTKPERADYTCLVCNKASKGTYSLPFVCTNCGCEVEAIFSLGHRASTVSEKCPRCQCVHTCIQRKETLEVLRP